MNRCTQERFRAAFARLPLQEIAGLLYDNGSYYDILSNTLQHIAEDAEDNGMPADEIEKDANQITAAMDALAQDFQRQFAGAISQMDHSRSYPAGLNKNGKIVLVEELCDG